MLPTNPKWIERTSRVARAVLERPLLSGLAVLALISLLFLHAPWLDLAVSALFYQPMSGFLHERMAIVAAIRQVGRLLEMLFAIVVIAPLAIKCMFPDQPLLIRPRAALFVLMSYVLGVGFVVNYILKDHWGRARPREISEFGGDATFTPAWWISDQCAGNCSFVSGEAAAAFWLMALAFIVPRPWRAGTGAAALAFAALVSFTRIAMGGHFLSDVLIAWLIMVLVLILLARAILDGLPATFDDRIEGVLGRAGTRVRQVFALRGSPPPL